jgi:hypothetical protein
MNSVKFFPQVCPSSPLILPFLFFSYSSLFKSRVENKIYPHINDENHLFFNIYYLNNEGVLLKFSKVPEKNRTQKEVQKI